jgi:peptidoglycan/LPS O-acetylase OafA/YrhL
MCATATSISIEEESQPEFRLGYRPFLDGVRGIAVLLVLVYHFNAINAIGEIPLGGFLGVDIFFVLSGFLITCLFYEEHQRSDRIRLKNFYIRRTLRLFPALIVLLGVTVWLTGLWKPALLALFYVANWALAFNKFGDLYLLDHTWSLSIEEQFYILYPLLFLFLVKLKPRNALVVLLILTGLIAINRAYLYSPLISITRVYVGLDTRADALLIGCICGTIIGQGIKIKQRGLNFAVILSALLLPGFLIRSHYGSPYLYYGGFTIFSACTGILLLKLLCSPPRIALRILENPLLVWIGRVSYGLYLWNPLVFTIINPPLPFPFHLVTQIAILFLIVGLSYYAIERPFLKLKKRFVSS